MPTQRADAAHIAPYLTHLITHHGQLTLVPPDNNGRRRKAKQSRSPRNPREESIRNSEVPSTSTGRHSRRATRASRAEERYNDPLEDIPDYPPPSFLEAMSSPPVSVCPSTTTLGRFTTPISRHGYNSDSDSESDDASLDIIDTENVPQPPVHAAETSSMRSRAPSRGRGILDPDPDDSVSVPSPSRSHRRHLSLSPLRTLFPSRNPRDSGLSAQSTPSSHSLAFSRSSPFIRSTTSLRNLTSSTPMAPTSPSSSSPPSLRSESFLASRRFFSPKGKERATSEALDSWEIVESALPAAPTTPEERSPVLVVSSANRPPQSPASVSTAPVSVHPLSERDRRAKIKSFVPPPRERERRVPPPPPTAPVPFAPGEGPPIITVRMKKPPPPPPKKKPVSSPLRGAALPELDLDRALRTPLPLTPVTSSPTSPFTLSTETGSPIQEHSDAAHGSIIPSPAPRSSSGASDDADADVDGQHCHHHYPGRPLPRRPRVPVDSTYAPHPDFPQLEIPQPPSVPEGLLIDLDLDAAETPTVQTPRTQPSFASASVDSDPFTPPMAADLQRNSSASSVDLAPASPSAEFMDLTDLDVLLARLENDHRDGSNYDDLWMVSDFIGPATPTRPSHAASDSASTSRQPSAKTSVLLTGGIEVQRRRTTKDGRVKLKLALLGIAVDRCGICMTQFKKAERARLSERCKHAFHERCLARWVVRSRTCPMCRIGLEMDGGSD